MITDEERRHFKQTDTMNLSEDLKEWLSNYYEANLSESISDEFYEMFGDMADDFIEKIFKPYKQHFNEPVED